MKKVEILALIRGEKPRSDRLGLVKLGNVKFFVDKTDRVLYAPHFIFDGPTLWG